MTQRFAGQPILPRWVEKRCNRVGLRMPDKLNLVDQLGLVRMPDQLNLVDQLGLVRMPDQLNLVDQLGPVRMPDHLDQLVRLSWAFLSEPVRMLDQRDLKLT